MTLYKATRENGHSFTGSIDYSPGLTGETILHPAPKTGSDDAKDYLSVSVEPGDCTGFSWPARLFEVEAVGRAWTPHKSELPNKRAVRGVTVVRELPAHLLLGPQGEALVAIIAAFAGLNRAQLNRLDTLRGAAWHTALAVAGVGRADRAGLGAARYALNVRLYGWDGDYSAYGAALAVLLRHTIGKDGFTQEHYNALTAPWVQVTGKRAHPEDAVL
jgi:hypothetical protein